MYKEAFRILYQRDKILAKAVAKVLGAKKLKMNTGVKNKINKEIGALITPKNKTRYFKEVPLQELFNILDHYGIVPLQEDNTEWSGILTGREGRAFLRLAPKDTKEDKTYTRYTNAGMLITWYKIGSGKYEIVCYIS